MSESPQKVGCAAPLGCCGCGCLGLLAVLGLGLAGAGILVWNGIRASGAYRTYQLAVERLEQTAVVVERLGDPLRPGWPSRLRFQEDEQAGWACLSFLITGSRRTGEVAVESERGGGRLSLAVAPSAGESGWGSTGHTDPERGGGIPL